MLNFKKGLAIVLAAATAFTFAPFTGFGTPVSAKADAIQTQNFILKDEDFTDNISGKADFATRGGGFGRGYDYIALEIPVDVQAETTYQPNSLTNVSDLHIATQASTSASVDSNDNLKNVGTEVKYPSTYTTGTGVTKIYVSFKLNSVSGGSFSLKDATTSGEHSFYDIRVDIKNTNGINKADDQTSATILRKGSNGSLELADHTNGDPKNYTYDLTMNSDSNDYYYVGIPNLGSVTSWTGKSSTATSAVARTYSGDAEWEYPSSNNKFETDAITSVIASGVATSTAKKTAFKVTTAHADTSSIYVDFFDTTNGKTTKISTVELKYTAARSNHAIDWIKWNDVKYSAAGNTYDSYKYSWAETGKDAYTLSRLATDAATGTKPSSYAHEMNPYNAKSATIVVKSESSDIKFVSTDTKIVEVTQDTTQPYVAKVTAKSVGSATINVFVGSTNNNKGKEYIIPVTVAKNGYDTIKVSDSQSLYENEDANTINIDAVDQTAANAVKSDDITFTSEGTLKFGKVSVSGDTSAVDYTQNDNVIKVTAKKKVSELSSPAVVSFTMTSVTEESKQVIGQSKTVYVVVWSKPAAQFSVDPVFLSLSDASKNTKVLETNPNTFTNVSWSVFDNHASSTTLADDDNEAVTLTNDSTGNTQRTAKIIAKKFGTAKVKAVVSETVITRKTGKTAKVTVGAEQANKITVDKASLVLTEGETATLTGKATTGTVTFGSADPTIASVTTGGAVTAVKAGQTTITAKADGATDVVIPVIVTEKKAVVVYATPAKVTGVKVSNKKGAKVTVKFTKDTTNKTMKYYVQKKVGKKTSGKSIGSTKTTLSVKKGATVKVRVKAYYVDPNGKKHVGKYSAWKTLKTDKK